MLDVHPPHAEVHSIKDFLIHILTITVGLLIALGLEGCVEKVHQHHLRNEADANIRQEIGHNTEQVRTTLEAAAREKQTLIRILQFLAAKSQGKSFDLKDLSLDFSAGTLSDANWRTATATGALTYMEYGRVESFSGAYQVQDLYMRIEEQTLDDYLQLDSYVAYGFDPNKVSPEDAKAAIPDVRKTLAHVTALTEIGKGLQASYQKALDGK